MSMRFWMLSGATIGGAAAMGLGLGLYVTSPQQAAVRSEAAAVDSLDAAAPSITPPDDPGPALVRCIGCGPTLEERRRAAEMAGMDADGMTGESRDPVVRDYLAQPDPAAGAEPLPDPSPSTAHRLPPEIERFATGERTPPPVLVPVAGAAPPPPVPTEPAEAGLPQ